MENRINKIKERLQATTPGAVKKTDKCNHVYIRCAGQYRTHICVYCGHKKTFGKEIIFTHARWVL